MFNRSKKSIPLENAILNGDIGQVRQQLKAGIDPNLPIPGESAYPLHYAAHSFANIIQLLVEYGADVNVKDDKGKTALHIASAIPYLEGMQVLIEHGADVNAVDGDGNTPLSLAQHGTPATSFFTNLGMPLSEEENQKRKKAMGLLIAHGAK